MSLNKPRVSSEDRIAGISPFNAIRGRLASLLGIGLVSAAVGCSGGVDQPGEGGNGPEQTFFACEASGLESPWPVSEWDITDMYNSDTLVPVSDTNPDTHILDLDYVAEAPLDQATVYKCAFKGGENCLFTANPAPNTIYEAAQLTSANSSIWDTWPTGGETTPRTSDKPLLEGHVALIHVMSSNPEGNGSYPVNISLNPECQ